MVVKWTQSIFTKWALGKAIETTASAVSAAAPVVMPAPSARTNTFAWGSGLDGKLGHGNSERKQISENPVVTFLSGVHLRSLSVGMNHSASILELEKEIVTDDMVVSESDVAGGSQPSGSSSMLQKNMLGVLFGWGSNFYGQAGFSMTDQKMGSTAVFTSDDKDDLDSIEIPNRLRLLTPPGITVDMKKVSCGDFHNAALARDGTLWTWGAGCLGRKDELYDSNAILVDFFPSRKRTVLDVHCADALTAALAESPSSGGKEVYIWGYFCDSVDPRKLQKSTTPLLITDALSLKQVTHVTCSRNSVAVAGFASQGSAVVNIYGPFWRLNGSESEEFDAPGYPMYHELQETDTFYNEKPTVVIALPSTKPLLKQVCVFRDLGFVVFEDGTASYFVAPIHSRQSDDARHVNVGYLTELQFSKAGDSADQRVSSIAINNFGVLVIFEGGHVRFWRLYADVEETWGLEETPKASARGMTGDEIVKKIQGELGEEVVEEGGKIGAVGWNHALVHVDSP